MSTKYNSYFNIALQKFFQDFWGVFSLIIISIISILSIGAYLFIPDKTTHANQGDLAIHSKPPGFQVSTIVFPQSNSRTFQELWSGTKSSIPPIYIHDFSVAKDTLFYTPYSSHPDLEEEQALPLSVFKTDDPSHIVQTKTFWLGTDSQGRDYLSRLILGTRVSLTIGLVAVFISLIIGVFLGALAGYFGGLIDNVILWIINIVWSIPTLLLVIAITLALGKGFWQVFLAVGLTMWVEVARVVRGQVLTVKEQQYITAAKSMGFSHWRIITKHVLPNCLTPVIIISAANFASAVLMESGLSFLGLGIQVPTPSWGSMIKENYNYILLGKAYLAIIPGFAIFILVISLMMIGNTLRRVLDVRQ